MMCNTCGKENPRAIVEMRRYREDGGAYHTELLWNAMPRQKAPSRTTGNTAGVEQVTPLKEN